MVHHQRVVNFHESETLTSQTNPVCPANICWLHILDFYNNRCTNCERMLRKVAQVIGCLYIQYLLTRTSARSVLCNIYTPLYACILFTFAIASPRLHFPAGFLRDSPQAVCVCRACTLHSTTCKLLSAGWGADEWLPVLHTNLIKLLGLLWWDSISGRETVALAVIKSLIHTLGNHRLRRRREFPPTLTNVQY